VPQRLSLGDARHGDGDAVPIGVLHAGDSDLDEVIVGRRERRRSRSRAAALGRVLER
jgi:hypothetical protein